MWPFGKKESHPLTHPAEMVAEAKNNPNGWVYAIEGSFGPADAIPPHRIKGAWKVDANGELTGEFMPNPNYRPSSAS